MTTGIIYSILVWSMDTKKRINRIIGQLKGIERMVEENRDCSDVLQQLTAIKKAIDGLSKEVVISGVCRFVPKEETKKIEEIMKRAINL